MTNIQAAIIAVGILAGAFLLTMLNPSWQIASGPNGSVWRLDIVSGEIELCVARLGSTGDEPQVVCGVAGSSPISIVPQGKV